MITPDRQSIDAIDVTSIDDLKALIGFDTLESDAIGSEGDQAPRLCKSAFAGQRSRNSDRRHLADLPPQGGLRCLENARNLVHRLRENAPLNPLQEDKLYGGGAEGHTDYPTLNASG